MSKPISGESDGKGGVWPHGCSFKPGYALHVCPGPSVRTCHCGMYVYDAKRDEMVKNTRYKPVGGD